MYCMHQSFHILAVNLLIFSPPSSSSQLSLWNDYAINLIKPHTFKLNNIREILKRISYNIKAFNMCFNEIYGYGIGREDTHTHKVKYVILNRYIGGPDIEDTE